MSNFLNDYLFNVILINLFLFSFPIERYLSYLKTINLYWQPCKVAISSKVHKVKKYWFSKIELIM